MNEITRRECDGAHKGNAETIAKLEARLKESWLKESWPKKYARRLIKMWAKAATGWDEALESIDAMIEDRDHFKDQRDCLQERNDELVAEVDRLREIITTKDVDFKPVYFQ